MAFDPKKHLMKIQGKVYLPVAQRIVWFREVHPDWGIETQSLEINSEKQYAIFQATIRNEQGRIMAMATKREDVKGFGDFIEKSETGAVGRALALCGFGTQFDASLHEGVDRVADSPQEDDSEEESSGPVRTRSVVAKTATTTRKVARTPSSEDHWGTCLECEEQVYYLKMPTGIFLVQNGDGSNHAHQVQESEDVAEPTPEMLVEK